MREIPLTRGMVALVDDEDYEMLSATRWTAVTVCGINYAMTTSPLRRARPRRTIGMHRFIMLPDPDQEVDHRDGNGLNNCRSNLRPCTRAQNSHNAGPRTTGYKGVSFHNRRRRYVAALMCDARSHFVGYFENPVDAALAYDLKAMELYGEFAYLNFLRHRAAA